MTILEMSAQLKSIGLKKGYSPAWEPESRTILLATRRPARIGGGSLSGSEIALCGSDLKVWTNRKRLALTLAKQHGLKVRALDGEAELIVPASIADALLPRLGAKVARTVSPEVAERSRAVLRRVREAAKHSEPVANASNLEPRPAQEGTSGDAPPLVHASAGGQA